jgi:Methyltransferase domain
LIPSYRAPFDYARVPSCGGTGTPPWVVLPLTALQSRSRCRRSSTYLGFRATTRWSIAASRNALIQDMYNRLALNCDGSKFHPKLFERHFAQVPLRLGDAVLNLCTGTALIALEVAGRVRPHSHVVSVDFADDMLCVVRSKAADSGFANASFILDDVRCVIACSNASICCAAAVWIDSLLTASRRWRLFPKPGGLLAFTCWTEGSIAANAINRPEKLVEEFCNKFHGRMG